MAIEADVADKANRTNKAKAMTDVAANKAHEAGEADAAKVRADDEVDEAGIADAEANEADAEANEANEADEAEAVDEAEVNEAIELPLDGDEANADNKIHLVGKAEEVNKAKSNKVGMSVEFPLLLPFSLTKYSAIFMEVKGCFGIFNNQLGGLTCWIVLEKKTARDFVRSTLS